MENEVAYFDLNVPWAQQAEKKSQTLGYKKKQFLRNISVILT